MTSHPILKFVRNDYYPYIVLPEAIELHLQGPQLPPRPPMPSKPKMPAKPIEPTLPKIPTKVMGKFQALASTGASVVALVVLIIAEAPFFVVAAGMSGVLVLAKFLHDSWNYEENLKHYYNVLLPRYEREKSEHSNKLIDWEYKCKQINDDYARRVSECETAYKNKIKEIYRAWKAGISIYQPINPTKPDCKSGSNIGRYDRLLRQTLQEKSRSITDIRTELFPENQALKIPGFDFPYTPDIAIRASKGNRELYIDIEIDEPWFNDNGHRKPSHTVDDDRQSKRDYFFREQDWIVIRFSERQVFQESDKCVALIYDLIRSIFQPGFQDLHKYPLDHERWSSWNALDEERY